MYKSSLPSQSEISDGSSLHKTFIFLAFQLCLTSSLAFNLDP